ncbi:hypothetical protein ACA910_010776 [Epithemia clementina (nom. ined.)]
MTLEECYANGYEVQDIIERVLAVVQPTLLLVSNRVVANERLIDMLSKSAPPRLQTMNDKVEDEDLNDRGSQQGHGPILPGMTVNATNGINTRPTSIPYQALKTSCFDVRNCKALILQKLRVRSLGRRQIVTTTGGGVQRAGTGLPADMIDHQRHFPLAADGGQRIPLSIYHALASLIDFESKTQIQAVGSLLSFLSNTVFRLASTDTSSTDGGGGGGGSPLIVVSDIVQANSSMFITVSAETLASLHIFSTEHHPLAVAKGTGNAKEGFSLFSLLDRTKSRSGRERMKEWMMKPLVDCRAICTRQDGVELFLLPEMAECRASIDQLLANVAAVDKILVRIQKCSAKPQDFLSLVRSLETATRIFEVLQHQVLFLLQQLMAAAHASSTNNGGDNNDANENQSDPAGNSIGRQILSSVAFVESLICNSNTEIVQDLAARLKAAVDLEATADFHSVLIRAGYDQELDMLKEQYLQLSQPMSAVAQEQIQRYPHLGELIDVIFLPQIGFHVRLKDDEQWSGKGSLPEEYEFIFTEGGYTFFKSPETRELDESVGDLDSFIKDKEAMIVAGLEDHILENDIELQTVFTTIADLDCILAFASCALEFGYVRPNVVPASECCIEIRKGRHPLQEVLLNNNFVPNDTAINISSRLSILTGPNYSGKSCYARQVGVLVYMAHIGSFIPCDEARISVIRQLFARFSSVETCAVPQSSFQLDLSQLGTILRRASPSSLVLIDEFGKGTSPASGIALLAAALNQLAASKALAVCTTHFLEIFSMGLLKDGENGIKVNQMAVQIPKRGSQLAFPLFRLEEGVASSSAGIACAEMAGLKRAVIDRASEIVEATRERRQVRPLTEILRDSLRFRETERSSIHHFIRTDWRAATKDDVETMLELIERMQS